MSFAARGAPARAEPPPTFDLSVVRLEGAGPCPSGRTFERLVAARLDRFPFTEPSERTIETVLSRRQDTWRAEITLRDASGIVQGRRAIEAVGTDCVPLVEATTLALALAIDPEAALGTSPATPVPEPLPAPVPPPALSSSPCPRPSCPSSPPCPAASCPPPTTTPYLTASVRAAFGFGLVPGFAPGLAIGAEAGSQRVRGQIGLLYLPETVSDDPRFAFGLTTAEAGACATFGPNGWSELGLCGELQLGAIHAVVHEAVPVEPGDELWVAAALGPRLRIEVLPVFLEIGASAVIPLLDRRFDVTGMEDPVFEPATVGGLGFAGVGLRAP